MFLRKRLSKRTSRGQSLVETALILPIIVLLLLLGIDLGRVFFTSIDLRNAAHEATMLGGTVPDSTCADMKATVDRQIRPRGASRMPTVCGGLGAWGAWSTSPTVGCEQVGESPASSCGLGTELARQLREALGLCNTSTCPASNHPPASSSFLTREVKGGSLPVRVENRSPVLIGYEGS